VRSILGLAVALVMLTVSARAQEDAVVYMDAQCPLEVRAVQSSSVSSIECSKLSKSKLSLPESGPSSSGQQPSPPDGYLVQGARNEFVIQHRKFLTEYSVNIDGVTSLQNFLVEDLEEAANLTTPLSSAAASVSKGAVPKGVATSGNLPQRTAQQFLTEMLDPATKAGPVTELNSDWLVLVREAERVEAEEHAFAMDRDLLLGTTPAAVVPDVIPPGSTGSLSDRTSEVNANCSPVAAHPSLSGAQACLHSIYLLEYSDAFPPREKYGDEDAFRALVVVVGESQKEPHGAIEMVKNLANVLSTQVPDLSSALNTFESDLAQYRADLNVFTGNMQALEDAREQFESLSGFTKKTEIRARLAQSLNPSGTTTVDAAELNKLADEYYSAAGGPNFHAPAGFGSMFRTLGSNIPNLPHSSSDDHEPGFKKPEPGVDVKPTADHAILMAASAAEHIGDYYETRLDTAYEAVHVKLPARVNEVNVLQSQVLSRANEIYDNSNVETPVRKQFNLGGQGGNLKVYFTVRMVETFPRFVIPPVSAQAATATSALPPPANPNTTQPASAPVNGSGAAPDTSSGVIVAHGEVDVHDLYHATMVAAFGFSGAGETTFTGTTVNTGTASDGITACSSATPCTKITVSRGTNHSSALVGLSYHPYGYDTFPRLKQKQNFKHLWGIMGGLSVQNLNDYYAGLDLQIAHALQVMGGANFYRQKALSPGYTNGGTYPGTPTFDRGQHWTSGAFGGIGLNLSIFRKAFGSVTGIGVIVPSKGN